MKRYVALWLKLLRLTWQLFPGQTAALLVLRLLMVGVTAATALAMRAVVNAVAEGDPAGAVRASAVTALTLGLNAYALGAEHNVLFLLVERVGLKHVRAQIDRDIAGLEGLDHLERTDFLDRVTVVRGAAWGLTYGMWNAVDTIFAALRLVVMLVLLGVVNPWLLLLLAFAAAPLWFERRGRKAIVQAELDTAERMRLQRHLFELATEARTNKEIRTAGVGPALARRQEQIWQEMAEVWLRARVRSGAWRFAGWSLFTLGFAGGMGLVAADAAGGAGSVGDVVLAIMVAVTMRESVETTVSRTATVADAGRLIEPYLWLQEYVAADRGRAKGDRAAPDRLRDGITFDHVSFTYPGRDEPALDDVSVHLPAGTVVALVGEYGSGKTTLVKLLLKFYRPDEGTIRVDGVDLAAIDTEQWRRNVSAAFQDFGRFHTAFAETIGLGDLEHLTDTQRIEAAIRSADAEELVRRLPDGLDTELGREQGGVDLSEGQWQKTALARASMRERPLLFVLDEPTASLDAPSEHAVFAGYMARARGLADRAGAIVVVVSHRFSTVAGADLILVLANGRLAETGTHEELLALDGRYAELYNIQATAYARA
ncbi:ABC transporter ATP-binding protein [Luedemannella helvata]|uniref:ABC transporter ATP-binding protein n=1 Tax=Luedemannella helvata TaxID=349315 RepID=A0ABP4VWU6_9ACTN